MYPVEEIVRHLVALAEQGEEHESLSPMRLHKLLYYVQGWSLALLGTPLFPERIEAWKDGPVVKPYYPKFAGRRAPITPEDVGDPRPLQACCRELLATVWGSYRRYSAEGLRDLTHVEPPWRHARERAGATDRDRNSEEITHDDLKAFFGHEAKRTAVPYLDPAAAFRAEDEVERGELTSATDVFRRLRAR
ncbi:MAG: Panacea domain-containing protein [Gemmataceae bacterium]